MKAFMFASEHRAGFKLVVFARTRDKAIEYVRNQSLSSISHRSLKYAGEGQPGDTYGWVAACVKDPVTVEMARRESLSCESDSVSDAI